MSEQLHIYTIYDHPSDFPLGYVVKKWMVGGKSGIPVQDPDFLKAGGNLDLLRRSLKKMGLTPIGRQNDDDPVIVESYI